MRARTFRLRLLAGILTALWAVAGVAVLAAYRPGGPADALVVATSFLPTLVAAAAVVWPPRFEGHRATVGGAWLAIASAVLLVPSIATIVRSLAAGGRQTLLPSAEVAYALLLALATTALFTGLGLVTAREGSRYRGATRLVLATLLAGVLTAALAAAFGGAAVANEIALRERSQPASGWGPTDPDLSPPACDGRLAAGRAARVEIEAEGQVDDGTSLGTVTLRGLRLGRDERWTAEYDTHRATGSIDFARVAGRAWVRRDGGTWNAAQRTLSAGALDRAVVAGALRPVRRAAAEELGVEVVGDARARHCRLAIDGPTALASFPALRPFLGQDPFARQPALVVWRGELDWWVFGDGELGMAEITIFGPAFEGWSSEGFQARLSARLTAVDRDRSDPIVVPDGTDATDATGTTP